METLEIEPQSPTHASNASSFLSISFSSKMPTRFKRIKPSPPPPIVLFYDPEVCAPDSLGRKLNTILRWPDVKLETCHDYIQYLFPIPERSTYHISAPIIDEETYLAFRQRPELRASLKRSYVRMLAFYGFEYNENSEEVYVSRMPTKKRSATHWVRMFDHNHLRITRILRSLRVLGLAREAEAFWKAVDEICKETGVISKSSRIFWTRAAKRPLRLAPEDEEHEEKGDGLLTVSKYAGNNWLPEYENNEDEEGMDIFGEQDEYFEQKNADEADDEKDEEGTKTI